MSGYVDHLDGDSTNNDPRNLRIRDTHAELAQALCNEFADTGRKRLDPDAAKHYQRVAVIDYATFLKESPFRSPEINERALERAMLYRAAALRAGANEEAIEKTFRQLRQYWIPRIVAANSNPLDKKIASG